MQVRSHGCMSTYDTSVVTLTAARHLPAHVLGTGEKSPPEISQRVLCQEGGLPPDHPNMRHFPGMLRQSWDSCPFDSCLQNTLWATVKLHANKNAAVGNRQPPPVAHRQVVQGDAPLESECFA